MTFEITKRVASICAIFCAVTAARAEVKPLDVSEIQRKNASEALAHATGLSFVKELKSQGYIVEDFDVSAFSKGFVDGCKNEKSSVTQEDYAIAINLMNAKKLERGQAIAKSNASLNGEWLAKNGTREGVQTTASGLQYEILRQGEGAVNKFAAAGDKGNTFTVQYKATNLDGEVFDATPKGKSLSMTTTNLAGLKEALELMPIGSVWKLYIKPELAFGTKGYKGVVEPNGIITVDIGLLNVAPTK